MEIKYKQLYRMIKINRYALKNFKNDKLDNFLLLIMI